MDTAQAKLEYQNAEQALKNSTDRLVRRMWGAMALMAQKRRPIGSPRGTLIAPESYVPPVDIADSFQTARFDPKSGRFTILPHHSYQRSRPLPTMDDNDVNVTEVHDRIALELHLNVFARFVDAFLQLVRFAPNDDAVKGDPMRTLMVRALEHQGYLQMSDLNASSEDLLRFYNELALDRLRDAIRAYESSRSVEAITRIGVCLEECSFYNSSLDDDADTSRALRLFNEYLNNPTP